MVVANRLVHVFARFQYNFETSFVADVSQLPLHGLETDCTDPGVLAQIDPSKHTWKNFPREMLLLGDDMKEWMEEDGQAEKENIPSSKRMKSDHSKIQFGTKVSTDEEIAKASKGFVPPNTAASRVNALYMRHNCIQFTEKKQQLLMFDFSAQIFNIAYLTIQ